MSVSIQSLNAAGALGSPITNVFPAPIISLRAPTANDKAPIGSMWVNSATQDYYVITSVVANVATWATAGNGNGIFASVEATAGDITADVGDIIATLGDIVAQAGAVQAQTDLVAVAGDIIATAGNVVVDAGNITATLGDIDATAGSVIAGRSFITGAASAGYFLQSGMRITSGAGAPAGGLALQAGDIYVRSDPAGAASRIYVATAAGAWTNITCAA